MAHLGCVRLAYLKTFGDFCHSFVDMIVKLCPGAQRIDYIFDSYIEGLVKDSERSRRCEYSSIEAINLKEETPLPVEMGPFLASSTNKMKL